MMSCCHTTDSLQKHAHLALIKSMVSGVAAAIVMQMPGHMPAMIPNDLWWGGLMSLITFVLIIYAGKTYLVGAISKLYHAHKTDMDTLVAISISAAWCYSTFEVFNPSISVHANLYFDTALWVLALIQLGASLEAKATSKTNEALTQLQALTPKTAKVIRDNHMIDCKISDLTLGDRVQLHPGEHIPADGTLSTGHVWIDEAAMTGESRLIEKTPQDSVIAGTLCAQGSATFLITAIAGQTRLAQIIAMVESAMQKQPRSARIADQICAVFVPIVIVIAIVTFCVWGMMIAPNHWALALEYSMTVLLIACPCALGLATPIALTVCVGQSSRYGILIKSPAKLEILGKIKTFLLDKTGTITQGTPTCQATLNCSELAKQQWLPLAISLASHSQHPLSKAITQIDANASIANISHIIEQPGLGVSGRLQGKQLYLGNKKMLHHYGISHNLATHNTPVDQGHVYFAIEDQCVGMLLFNDPIKKDAKAFISSAQALGIGCIMISGDHRAIVQQTADAIGITQFYSEQSPASKVDIITKKQQDQNLVAMVGDGINDAASLAQADLGIAMAYGSDIAMESADIIVTTNHLLPILHAIKIAQLTQRTIYQNLLGALFYNICAIPIAAGVLVAPLGLSLTPTIAAFAMACSSLTVIVNALKLNLQIKKHLKKPQ